MPTTENRVDEECSPAPAYLRRPELWADRSLTVTQVRRLIDTLDPKGDCAAITHLSLEVIAPPLWSNLVYIVGGARAVVHRGEAVVGYRGGKSVQMTEPEHRDRDTLSFFGLLYRYGPDSREVRAVVDRIQQIHHDVKGVSVELQRHVLALLIVEQERWTRDLGQPGWFRPIENEARFHLWTRVGELMGIENLWASYDDVEPWLAEWESRNATPSREALLLYAKMVEGFSRWFPGPISHVAGQLVAAGLAPVTRRCVGNPFVAPGVRSAMALVFAGLAHTDSVRRVSLSSTWVKDFSRFGNDPDIHGMGYQHDVANDPRYQRVGPASEGYHFTVAEGLQRAPGTPE